MIEYNGACLLATSCPKGSGLTVRAHRFFRNTDRNSKRLGKKANANPWMITIFFSLPLLLSKTSNSGIACQRPTSKAGDSTKRSCAPLVTLQKSNICSQARSRLPDLKRVKTSRHMKAASSSFDLSDPPQVRESMTSKDVPPSPRRYVLWGFKRLSTGCRRTCHCRG